MVRTLLRSALREIRQSLGRYLAILAIVGLGVGFFAGLRTCQPAMMATGLDYLSEHSLHDFRLLSTLGFTQEDVDNFAALDGVAAARGAVYADFLTEVEPGREVVLRAHSLTAGLHQPALAAGRMPQADNECLADARYFSEKMLGAVLAVSESNEEETRDLLHRGAYTVVGLCWSPYYLNYDRGTSTLGGGSVAGFVYIPEGGFDFEAYYEIFLTVDDPALAYSIEYGDQIDAIKPAVEELTDRRAQERYDEIRGDALEEIADAEREIADGWDEYRTERTDAEAELDDAYRELTDGEAEYAKGQRDYEQGRRDYAEGLREFADGQQKVADAQQEVADAQQKLDDGQRELDDARRELDEGWDEYYSGKAEAEAELTDALKELTDGEAAYSDGLQELSEGRAELAEGQQKLEDAQRELADAQRKLDDAKADLDRAPGELADARRELDEGWTEYNDGKSKADREFADAEAELTDAEREVADAYAELADLKQATTYVLTRQENTGYVNFDNDTSIVAAISVVFPAFFFLVAALVCMTTMTRMVDEQRTQIGVLKAMGYSNWQIMGKYLFYAGSAALLGSVLGYALGAVGLPWIIWEIYGMIYGFAPLKQVFLPELALLSFSAALLCAMGSTYLACRVELGRQAAELIRPKSPRAGKRVFLEYIGPVWRRLSFLHKVSVRNVLRYRSRLVMMVLGIGGCTALLCTGFGIRDSIAHVADDQFDEITLYDYAVTFQEGQTLSSAEAYLEASGWLPEEGLLVHSGSVDVQAPGGGKSVHLVVSSTDSLDGFLSLHSGETAIPYPGDGEVVVNTGLAEKLGLSVGDTVRLQEKSLGEMEATVSAIADNYVFNYAYVSAGTFQRQLGRTPEYNTLYVRAHPGADPYEEGALLLEDEGVGSVTVNEATRSQVDSMLSRLDYIVAVVVLCAAALAFIVLYNLTNINITERVREIATIKVLGFYQGEVAAYVFREIIILSALGSLAGLGMGKALHAFVMEQIQIDAMFFACRITPLSYLVAFVVTMLFTAVISLGMRPRLRKIDMAESLKSIE